MSKCMWLDTALHQEAAKTRANRLLCQVGREAGQGAGAQLCKRLMLAYPYGAAFSSDLEAVVFG
jgi:hypothetical protein